MNELDESVKASAWTQSSPVKDSYISFLATHQTCTDCNHVTMLPTQLIALCCIVLTWFCLFNLSCFLFLFCFALFFSSKVCLKITFSLCFDLHTCFHIDGMFLVSPLKGNSGIFQLGAHSCNCSHSDCGSWYCALCCCRDSGKMTHYGTLGQVA